MSYAEQFCLECLAAEAKAANAMVNAVPINVRPMNDGARRKNCRLKWQPKPLPINHWPIWLPPSGRPICKSHTTLAVALTSNGPNSHGFG